jgi:serine/threonine protein kinase
MAKQLVNAVYYVHLYGFVHKNIRPETILSISKVETGSVPITVFLIGFEVVRNAEGRTNPANKVKWQSDLYRHPSRQDNHPDYYVMQHDVYGLGVCLLEIGMWVSLIMYDTSGVAHPSSVFDHDPRQTDASSVKDYFVHLSRSIALRGKMGTKYSEVVQTCLTCLDENNCDFGDEEDFQGDDGIAVGVRYLEKGMDKLNDIHL